MRKFIALLVAMMMVFAMTAVAEDWRGQADNADGHTTALTEPSTQEVKITISGLVNGGDDESVQLPSEYHVRVLWDIQDGVYNATKTDGVNGFKNFTWDCVTLQYILGDVADGAEDVREGNWVTKPHVKFEVTNASTPDLSINAAASLSGDDAWAAFLDADSIADQNAAIATQTISPVAKANMGTGVDSRELGAAAFSGLNNTYAYEYVLNWNYDALNAEALANYKAGTGSETFTNTFVVTISAN